MKNIRGFVRLRTAAAFDEWKKQEPELFHNLNGDNCAIKLEQILDDLDNRGIIPVICQRCNGNGKLFNEEDIHLGTWEWVCELCNENGYIIPNEIKYDE